MTSTPEPKHLNSHQRNTLNKILQHPANHNVEWRSVASLLEALGSVVPHHHGKVAVTVGPETAFLDIPEHKDIDIDALVDLRRMLTAAGYGASSKAVDREDQDW